MTDIHLDYEMKPETLKKLNEVLGNGKVELSRAYMKGTGYYYVLTQGPYSYRGLTICSAVEKLHEVVLPKILDEVTVNGVVYVKKTP